MTPVDFYKPVMCETVTVSEVPATAGSLELGDPRSCGGNAALMYLIAVDNDGAKGFGMSCGCTDGHESSTSFSSGVC